MIRFTCPQCRARLSTSDEKAGRTLKCPGCRTPVEAPLQPPSLLAFYEGDEALEEAPESRRSRVWIANAAVVAVVLGIVSYLAVGSAIEAASLADHQQAAVPVIADPDPVPPQDMHNLTDDELAELARRAYARVCEDVGKALKAPATAKFAETFTYSSYAIAGANQRQFTVESHVDAQNSYGVPIRERIVGYVSYHADTGEWDYFALYLGDSPIVQDESIGKLEKLMADTRETHRFKGRGERTTKAFDVYSKWWRFNVNLPVDQPVPDAGGEFPNAVVEVVDSLGAVVFTSEPVEYPGQWLSVVEKSGTFRLRVKGRGRWEVVVQEPIR